MSDPQNENVKIIKKIEELSQILQKFGLDIITQFGKSAYNLRILTDKIDKLDKTTLDIKALLPKLNNIIDNQNILESEIDLLKSLIQRANISLPKNELEIENIERDKSITKNKQIIKDQFTELIDEINKTDDIQLIKKQLEKVKENIFELTGGHKITYEISQVITKLNNASSLSESLKNYVKEKIGFFINKL